MSNETVRYGQYKFQNDIHMSMPTIKCSLCKSSTPTKQTANQIESDSESENVMNESDMYDSMMLDMSNISSLSSDATIWRPDTVHAHEAHCANRFVVRIFTRSK